MLKIQKDYNKGVSYLGLDGMYKLTNIQYPLFVATTMDLRHRVLPIAFCISSQQDQSSFEFFLDNLESSFNKLQNMEHLAVFVMSDRFDVHI